MHLQNRVDHVSERVSMPLQLQMIYGKLSKFGQQVNNMQVIEKKEEIWLSPMTKSPTPTEKSKKQLDDKKRHQKLWLHNDCGPT